MIHLEVLFILNIYCCFSIISTQHYTSLLTVFLSLQIIAAGCMMSDSVARLSPVLLLVAYMAACGV